MSICLPKLKEQFEKHPKLPGNFTYGTAGFRMKADLLDSIMFVTGILAALRSKFQKGKVIGAMVTASHNQEEDNGVKLVDPMGEMLEQSWEEYAIWLANAEDFETLVSKISEIVKITSIDLSIGGTVVSARDTRSSAPKLLQALQDGIEVLDGTYNFYGFMTTPQLHYITRCLNTENTPQSYGVPTREGYYEKLSRAYKKVVGNKPRNSNLTVDCANGVGAIVLKEFQKYLGDEYVSITISHDATNNPCVLNHNSGADFVKVQQRLPKGTILAPNARACSFDGDGDRIVFYYVDEQNSFKLLDGDKIATLAAGFIMKKIKEAKISHTDGTPLRVGLVQTAYANGSSTSYVKDIMQVPVVFTPTGVKYLHHEAAHFDVGIYFEANGHGTVLFSDAAVAAFNAANGETNAQKEAISVLQGLSDLINQTVGDALSDLLMVEAILVCSQQSFSQWNSIYTDLPSRQEKVKVDDRTKFIPINADTELVEPKGLQERIIKQVSKFPKGRCFVRPSGTEDVVRVYAEAESASDTELLSQIVCGIVFDYYGGVGERPSKFKKTNENGEIQ